LEGRFPTFDATRVPVSWSKGQRSGSRGLLMLTHILRYIFQVPNANLPHTDDCCLAYFSAISVSVCTKLACSILMRDRNVVTQPDFPCFQILGEPALFFRKSGHRTPRTRVPHRPASLEQILSLLLMEEPEEQMSSRPLSRISTHCCQSVILLHWRKKPAHPQSSSSTSS